MNQIHEHNAADIKKGFTFSARSITDNLDAYMISISREIRSLKKIGIINYELLDRPKSQYKLTIKGKTTKKAILEYLQQQFEILNKPGKNNPGFEIIQILDESRNRRLSKVSTESQKDK